MPTNEKGDRGSPASREHYIEGHSRNLKDRSSYLHSDHSFIDELAQALKNSLDPGSKVLEVGCGGGHSAAYMARLGFRVTAIDFSTVAIETAKENYRDVVFVTGDANDLKFEDADFDAVVAIEMIEHLEDPRKYIAEAARVLRPGGSLFIKTPNRLLHDLYYRKNERISLWHPSVMSARELMELLDSGGFSVRFVKMNRLPGYQVKKLLSKLGPLASVVKPVARVLPIGFLPLSMQPSLIAVATKRSTETVNGRKLI